MAGWKSTINGGFDRKITDEWFIAMFDYRKVATSLTVILKTKLEIAIVSVKVSQDDPQICLVHSPILGD